MIMPNNGKKRFSKETSKHLTKLLEKVIMMKWTMEKTITRIYSKI